MSFEKITKKLSQNSLSPSPPRRRGSSTNAHRNTSTHTVTPAKAGVQKNPKKLDSRLRGNDDQWSMEHFEIASHSFGVKRYLTPSGLNDT